jgi:hypothetical protein
MYAVGAIATVDGAEGWFPIARVLPLLPGNRESLPSSNVGGIWLQ